MSILRHADKFKQVHGLLGAFGSGIMAAIIHRKQNILYRSKSREELEELKEKQKILLGLQQACREVKKQEKGELKEQTLDE